MLTLDNLLTENRIMTRDEAYIHHAVICSPFLARLLNKNLGLMADLLLNLDKEYQLSEMTTFLSQQDIEDEVTLKRVLRLLRQHVMARIMVRDLNHLADLDEVMRTTSLLAEYVINSAIDFIYQWMLLKYGRPVDYQGNPQHLIVVGMGKLGGFELNVSSDVDLIFAYANEGKTNGENSISNQDFFTYLAKKLIAALDEITEDGFVFRVDMRLRPYGSEGALVSNIDALEDYYQNNGREWERYAWIKGREITGGQQVTQLLRPFVFRKYLDYGAFASMRELKIQIQRDVNTKGIHDNIKLGRGGIREIEFIAQVFQLIRGGQDLGLQIRPTLQVLNLLKKKGLLPEKTVKELTESYIFLRNLEHRLMYVEDAQTQELPKADTAKKRIAQAMDFKEWGDFLTKLNNYRRLVQHHFDATFKDVNKTQDVLKIEQNIWNSVLDDQDAILALKKMGFSESQETLRRLRSLHEGGRYKQLPELSRQRFDALMPIAIFQAAEMSNADVALIRVTDLLESICRRASYLALLAEHPHAMLLLIKLCNSSPWLTNYLVQHPILLDELLDTRVLYSKPDFEVLHKELVKRLADAEDDVERQMDVMRHFKHANVFRFAVQDINGELLTETLSDYLSALAEVIFKVSLKIIWSNVRGKHIDQPKFAVIGYGKFGGKELGYASDLDIIFLYDDEASEASEIYARFAQRINNWFNSLTSAGLLYETDLQLRPDGNSGLLVSSIAAFREYQLKKAWTWEHQAITRARYVAGDEGVGQAFEQIRIEVMTQPRDQEKLMALKFEVQAMREKMRAAHQISSEMFDIKHSIGGIVDVEFLVQYLVLVHAINFPELTENIGNIGLLHRLASINIIDLALAEKVVLAYRRYRNMQHMLKLQGVSHLIVEKKSVIENVIAVTSLWSKVFGS